jgi:putative FmdB family regulatory protein
MPTYNYRCRDNLHSYTENRSITKDQQNYECPECGSELKRVFYAPGIQFNGSGFYKTSNKDKKNYE